MKKRLGLILLCLGVLLTIGGSVFYLKQKNQTALYPQVYQEEGLKYVAKVEGREFYLYEKGTWQKKFLKGVNIGAAKPGHFPGELAITEEDYLRWFQDIRDLHADVIRVYTTMQPDFYNALYAFNKQAEKPLYLIQGVWVKEEDIATYSDAYAEQGLIMADFIRDAQDLVDIIHGKATLPARVGFASGTYTKDVSPYVIAWILGIEWDPYFVEGTDTNNPEKNTYTGDYLCTTGASPFETFLCTVGDKVLAYEAEKYQMTRPVSFSNWPTTDMLAHPNEPYEKEDMAVVNLEHLKSQPRHKPGLFASYHVYPYYPDFMSYQKEYREFVDEQGEINTYKAYLRALFAAHTMPVMIAEFGVPASRGKAHDSLYSGYNQGQHDETEQGRIVTALLADIFQEDYCGALIFTWQDEWFKRTWNTMDFDLPDRRPFWSNPQTNEQEFGLLAFDPGKEKSICYVDGEVDDWQGEDPLFVTDQAQLYVKSDAKYVYLWVEAEDFAFGKDTLYIAVDVAPGQGNTRDKARNLSFTRPVDFLLEIKNKDDSRILVDAYYDSFYYLYGEQLNMVEKNPAFTQKDSGLFNPLYHCLSREIYLPEDAQTIPFSQYETGRLKHGNANPGHANYHSLTDFSFKDGNLEIRIPWQLLNVMDPSSKAIMADFYQYQAFEAKSIDGLYFGLAMLKSGEPLPATEIALNYYTWHPWEFPAYHERLKRSYYLVQAAFKALE